VSDFHLDNYEITIGRFRKFVAVYSPTITPVGAGKNPNNGSDPGWDAGWNTSLAAGSAALQMALASCGTYSTWTTNPGSAAAESRPITCVTWFEAEAFCIWDGGRLPTEAEWNYAAAGGAAQRLYPWGSAAPDCTYANFYGAAGGTDYCVAPGTGAVNRVGSESPKGDGLYGQADLAGNVWEWVQDWYVSPYTNPCSNCAHLAVSSIRMFRGGNYTNTPSNLVSSYRSGNVPSYRGANTIGARCARGAQ
jgi:formylglycine-generating enzyme required for sulfatase activity